MKNRHLFILCGLQYSGKTYLSTILSRKFKINIISFDEIYKKIACSLDSHVPSDQRIWKLVKDEAYLQLNRYFTNNKSVIWDSTNPYKGYRESLKYLSRKKGFTPILLYVNTPVSVIKQRHNYNLRTKQRHSIDSDELEKSINEFDAPLASEQAYEYKYGDDIEKFIKELHSSLNKTV